MRGGREKYVVGEGIEQRDAYDTVAGLGDTWVEALFGSNEEKHDR